MGSPANYLLTGGGEIGEYQKFQGYLGVKGGGGGRLRQRAQEEEDTSTREKKPANEKREHALSKALRWGVRQTENEGEQQMKKLHQKKWEKREAVKKTRGGRWSLRREVKGKQTLFRGETTKH